MTSAYVANETDQEAAYIEKAEAANDRALAAEIALEEHTTKVQPLVDESRGMPLQIAEAVRRLDVTTVAKLRTRYAALEECLRDAGTQRNDLGAKALSLRSEANRRASDLDVFRRNQMAAQAGRRNPYDLRRLND